ncbi:MAG: hypothetical protein M3463_11525, partial [Verrucomicrobiota bacterium]|nr:hypothetical protein [Verrucomicrobiota bacterium]
DFTIGGPEAAAIIATLGFSNVVVSTDPAGPGNGDVFIDAPIIYSSDFSFTILAHRHVFANASIQNEQAAAGGAVNLVAGWDGVTEAPGGSGIQPIAAPFNIANIVSTPSSFGNADGVVFIGDGTQAAGIAVGSRSGTTTVAGFQLLLSGSTSAVQGFSQLGFQTDLGGTAASGDISVQLRSDLIAVGGIDQSYAQVGHGGSNFSGLADTAHTGVITIDNSRRGTSEQVVLAGGGVGAYAQIGHGGIGAIGDHSGVINVTSGDLTLAGGALTGAYSKVGHGGTLALGNQSGAITVTSSGNLSLLAGGDEAYAQLGHGGILAAGNHSGAITVATGNVTLAASGSNTAYAQLGHGGFEADGNHSEAIVVGAAGNVALLGGTGDNSYTQLGHGGLRAAGNHSGAVTLFGGDLTLQGGSGMLSYAQLGHGGLLAAGNHSGAIAISALDVTLAAGMGVDSYAHVGHGGCGAAGNHSGAITITADGDLSLTSGALLGTYTQIGHGGCFADGSLSGALDVTARNALFQAGTGLNSYSFLGHGGIASGPRDGSILLSTDVNLTLSGVSSTEFARIGHFTTLGAIAGAIIVAVDQLAPLVDNGGTLTMNEFSLIDAGGAPNNVSIFDNRREPGTIANGAIVNGVVFDNSLPLGTLIAGRWNQNTEGVSWAQEQWGPTFTVATPGPYAAPFTFFFNDTGAGPVLPPVIPPFEEPDGDTDGDPDGVRSPRTLSEIFDDGFFANNNGEFRNRFEPNLPLGLWWILYSEAAPQSPYLRGPGRLGSWSLSTGDAALVEDFAIFGGSHAAQYRAIPRRSHSAQHSPHSTSPEASNYAK